MKNLKKLLVVAPLVLASTTALAACGEDAPPHVHSLTKTEAVAESCTTGGNSAYYTCNSCGKFYSDAEGKNEIAQNSWVINAKGHTYSAEEDIDCNDCGHIRETATYSIWEGGVENLPTPSAENVYTITTAEQLAKLAQEVNAGNDFTGYTFELEADIDLGFLAWDPIGYGSFTAYQTHFNGIFDGKGHTIYNLSVVGTKGGCHKEGNSEVANTELDGSSAGVGLFGNAHKDSVIKNLNIKNAYVQGNHFVGALVGYGYGVDIDNCTVDGAEIICDLFDDEENGDKAGVVAGQINSTATMTNCTAKNSTVSASRDAGQVVGCASVARETFAETNRAENVTVTHNGNGTGANLGNVLMGRLSL